ncbi:hypothetical protein BZG25_12220 [Salinivibrio sp. ML198]|uniref:NUDIX hydrolase n=1 Tax=unclassified Salinivibrio TaxID=2636825 RepID=UPI0009C50342|nr:MULTISPECIES: NUDIX hydrolase [unclassified Salinivibrio]OOE65542.1 hypothetical protein BZG20_11715 [Salinivibrio sp. IB868]OOE74181.1 hypothetical protein BZG22_08540 [Salinivibrio sp. IB870]OOE78430.1 hypothetical protein BZG25_12220 [Salinivibrio sp. ML198]
MNDTLRYQWKKLSLVETHTQTPDGLHHVHHVIRHPGAAVILPLSEDGNILLLKQFRPAINQWIIEAPAGTLEAKEPPLEAAKRELEEEAGYVATRWHFLGIAHPVPGFCDEVQYFYIAQALTPTQTQLDDDEFIAPYWVSPSQLQALVANGQITDTKTCAIILRALFNGLIPTMGV